jgi:hypothetical protein
MIDAFNVDALASYLRYKLRGLEHQADSYFCPPHLYLSVKIVQRAHHVVSHDTLPGLIMLCMVRSHNQI